MIPEEKRQRIWEQLREGKKPTHIARDEGVDRGTIYRIGEEFKRKARSTEEKSVELDLIENRQEWQARKKRELEDHLYDWFVSDVRSMYGDIPYEDICEDIVRCLRDEDVLRDEQKTMGEKIERLRGEKASYQKRIADLEATITSMKREMKKKASEMAVERAKVVAHEILEENKELKDLLSYARDVLEIEATKHMEAVDIWKQWIIIKYADKFLETPAPLERIKMLE